MKKICVIGAPSVGKTTVALLLGVRLKMLGYEVHFVLEYATNYIIRNGTPKAIFEQLAIFHGQKDEEGYIEKNSDGDFLVCDSASFLPCIYARHYHPGRYAAENEIKKYNYALKTLDKWAREQTLASYAHVFFLPPEIPFKKNSIRWQADKAEAEKISDEIEAYLKIEGRQYYRISGSLNTRVKKIMKILKEAEEKEKNLKIFPLIE